MTKKYRVVSKFRFTIFIILFILTVAGTVGTMFGFNTASSSSRELYSQIRIEAGDTLWEIASEYAPAQSDPRKVIRDICTLNDMTAGDLQAGQKIIIPVYE